MYCDRQESSCPNLSYSFFVNTSELGVHKFAKLYNGKLSLSRNRLWIWRRCVRAISRDSRRARKRGGEHQFALGGHGTFQVAVYQSDFTADLNRFRPSARCTMHFVFLQCSVNCSMFVQSSVAMFHVVLAADSLREACFWFVYTPRAMVKNRRFFGLDLQHFLFRGTKIRNVWHASGPREILDSIIFRGVSIIQEFLLFCFRNFFCFSKQPEVSINIFLGRDWSFLFLLIIKITRSFAFLFS